MSSVQRSVGTLNMNPSEIGESAIIAAVGVAIGAIWWLIRRIFTNSAEIQAIKQTLCGVDERLDDLNDHVKEVAKGQEALITFLLNQKR